MLHAAALLIMIAGACAAMAAPGERTVVRPADTGAPLVNPAMGWTLHYYSNIISNYGSKLAPSDTVDEWPGLSVIYLRVPWSFLEPEEGRFNWTLFDTPAQRFIARGKRIALRISCSESWMRWATPRWVADAGAKGVDFNFGAGPVAGGQLWDPDFLDPVFLTKLERFVAALARRYDGNPNVDFVDVGSFGMWGEGHTLFSSKLDEARTLEAGKRHIDLYRKHFRRTQLCISDDMAGPTAPGPHQPITDYALSRGVSLRDDSILVQPPPDSWYHAEMAQAFWPRMPVILEHEHYGPSKGRGAWSNDLLVKAVEDYHASYMSIHWWPREELSEVRPAVERINQRMGYRLQLREASWPAEAAIGEPFELEAKIANAGVAPCYPGGFPAFTIKDERGGIVSLHVGEAVDLRSLAAAAPAAAAARTIRWTATAGMRHTDPLGQFAPTLEPGTYNLFFSVGSRDGTPRIALPLTEDDGQRRYRLGRITLTPRR